MENLCDLLFEVSNEDRLSILKKLLQEEMNISRISRVLGLSAQETSRHVTRLSDVKLTRKDPEGPYYITAFGRLVVNQLSGLEFVSLHEDYFSSHSLESLPQKFLSRIGELANSKILNHVMASWGKVEDVMREANEFVWAVADQYISTIFSLESEALERGVKIKLIEPEDWQLLSEHKDEILPEIIENYNQARVNGNLKEKIVKKIGFFLYMSEKEVAALAFPTIEGKMDYIGFTSDDKAFYNWCKELFSHYWDVAERRREFVLS